MIWLVAPQNFKNSIWGRKISLGLRTALRKRRVHFTEADSPENLSEGDTVFLFGSDLKWICAGIEKCNSLSVIPYLVQKFDTSALINGKFHLVCFEMKSIIADLLKQYPDAALFGINQNSVSDWSLAVSYNFANPGGCMIVNSGSLKKCVDELLSLNPIPKNILCANDFAAIELSKQLPAGATIISLGSTHLSEYYQARIQKVPFDSEKLCQTAVSLWEFLEKQPDVT